MALFPSPRRSSRHRNIGAKSPRQLRTWFRAADVMHVRERPTGILHEAGGMTAIMRKERERERPTRHPAPDRQKCTDTLTSRAATLIRWACQWRVHACTLQSPTQATSPLVNCIYPEKPHGVWALTEKGAIFFFLVQQRTSTAV